MPSLHKDHIVFKTAFLDPAGGKENRQRLKARSAIVVVGADAADRKFVLDSWAERCATEKIYAKIYEMNAKHSPNIFGIEGNAQQGLFADSVIKDAREKGINITIQTIIHPTTMNKDFRIRTFLQPLVHQGRFFVDEENQDELMDEITSFPMSSVKDLIDACASACSMIPKQKTAQSRSAEAEAHLRYLRESGAPMHQIERAAESYGKVSKYEDLEDFIDKIRSS